MVLAVVGVLLVPFADAGVWTRRELLQRDGFTNLSLDVLGEPDVTAALSSRIIDEIQKRVTLTKQELGVIDPAVRAAIGTAAFQAIFRGAVGQMHDQLTRGDDRLSLDLDPVYAIVHDQVAKIDADVAAQIPESAFQDITVVKKDQVPALWRAVDIVRRASLVFPAVALLALAAAVALARRRAVMLIVIGAAVVLVAVLLMVGIKAGRDPLSNVAGPQVDQAAFDAGYGVVANSFVNQTLVVLAGGALVLVAGVLLKVRSVRNTRPTGWA